MAGRKPKPRPRKRPAAAPPGAPALRLEWRSPAELAENPANWRRHPAAQLAALADVIGEVGWAGACLLNERTGRLIDGHARRKVALEQGADRVPVLVGDWSEGQEAKILATLDPIAGMAGADAAALDALLRDVRTSSQAVADLLTALAESAGVVPAAGRPAPGGGDEPPAGAPTRCAAGDLWAIGPHRLLVGDCTADGVPARLGLPGDFVTVLDPPFEADERVWARFLRDPTILFGQGKHLRAVPRELYRFERVVDKVTGHRSATVQVSHRHAFVVQCGTDRRLPRSRETFDSIVAHPDRPDHPHEKPVALLVEHLDAWTPEGPVFEPFAGSGSGLVAAHRTGRAWYGCEREPRYADVILARAEAEGLGCERGDDGA